MALRVATALVPLALMAAMACGKASSGSPRTADATAVRASVDSAMRNHFAAFERGDLAAWSGMFAPDVFFTAANPAQVFASRDSAREGMQLEFGPAMQAGLKLAIRPLSDQIWVAEDGRTAAAAYDLDYTVRYENQVFPYRLRSSYLLERDSSGWSVLAAQYSRPISYDTLFMSLVTRKIPSPARIGGEVPSSTGEVVARFRSDVRDIRQAIFAPGASAITPGAIVQGPENARGDLAQWLGPVGNATEPGTGMRGGLNQDGTVGWVATNLYVPIFAGPESTVAPMRALFIYRLANGRWEIVQASLSVGLRDRS